MPTAPRPAFVWILRAAKVLFVTGALVAAVTARVLVSGEREIAASTAALRKGDPHEAAFHARRAAGYYAPGAPHVRVAYERLLALATKAEQVGDRATALYAWEGVRTASLETRWILTPHAADLERANANIARIQSTQERTPDMRVEPAAVLEREALAALVRDESPHVPWVITLVAAFVAWTIGAALTLRRGVTSTGQILWTKARVPLALTALGVLAWLLSLWRA